jgi:hypothetical protein
VLQEITRIVEELTWALEGWDLAGCGCTSYDITVLVAALFKVDIISASVFLLRSLRMR